MSCHIVLYHIIYHIMAWHVMSCHVISYHISYHVMSYRIVSYYFTSYHISYHIMSYRIISHHIISIISYHFICLIMSCHIVSYYIISYHIIRWPAVIRHKVTKLNLCLFTRHIMMKYGAVGVWFHAFLTLERDASELSASRPIRGLAWNLRTGE
jgi:hypothetical protein